MPVASQKSHLGAAFARTPAVSRRGSVAIAPHFVMNDIDHEHDEFAFA
jgi:hypothetical protein